MTRRAIFMGWVLLLAVSCGTPPGDTGSLPTPAAPVSVDAADNGDAIALATFAPDEFAAPDSVGLRVWMLESIAPGADFPGSDVLVAQLAAFDDTHPGVEVEVQAKRATGRGSTLDYLHTAPPVAPSVLPDVALLNRDTLVQAAIGGLLVPWGEDTALITELYPPANELGRVDGTLFGIPYMLDVRHTVYRETFFRSSDALPLTFESLLPGPNAQETLPYVFVASRSDGVNTTTLLQYLAAGGRVVSDSGNPVIDVAPLAEVLTFYEQAGDAGVLNTNVLQYTTSADAWSAYLDGRAVLADVRSSSYLADRAEVRNTGLASVPTANGQPITQVTGWSWVLLTDDPARQALALELINWLMEPVNHGTYSEAAGLLPSQPQALAVWGSDDPYVTFANDLLEVAVLPLTPDMQMTLGMPMQNAVEDVLLDRASAQEAAAQAAATLQSGDN